MVKSHKPSAFEVSFRFFLTFMADLCSWKKVCMREMCTCYMQILSTKIKNEMYVE